MEVKQVVREVHLVLVLYLNEMTTNQYTIQTVKEQCRQEIVSVFLYGLKKNIFHNILHYLEI